jgi:ABC-type phosphate/phosphonate transport system substrate-binding protein
MIDIPLLSQNDNKQILTINIGIASNLFPEVNFNDTKTTLELWSKDLQKDIYMDYYLIPLIYRSNDEIIKAFRDKKIEIAAIHALDYLYIKNESGVIPLLIPSMKNHVTENYIILANKKSNIKNIHGLRNKKVAVQSIDLSLIPYVWFENIIMMKESELVSKFCNLSEANKDSKAIISVFFNQKDACVVRSKSYYELCKQNHQLKDDLVIIESSPDFIRDIFCISQNLEKKYIDNLLDWTFKLQSYESGKRLLNLFQFELFTVFEDKYIKSLENLLSDNKKYHKKLKNRK